MTHDEMHLRKKIGEQVFWYQRRNLTSVRLLRQSRYLESRSARISLAKRNSARKHDNYALDCRLDRKSSEGNTRDKEREGKEEGEGEGEGKREREGGVFAYTTEVGR